MNRLRELKEKNLNSQCLVSTSLESETLLDASGISQVLGSGHPTRVAKCNEPHVAKAKTRKPSFARFHKGQMIAVKGEACRVPATESPSALGPQNISRQKVSLFFLIFTASFQVISCHFTLFDYQLRSIKLTKWMKINYINELSFLF